MSKEQIPTAIKQKLSELFEPELIAQILLSGKPMRVSSGQIILDIGQHVKVIPLVLSGTVKVSTVDPDGKELLLYYINSTESCAMTFTCCMQQHPSEIKAVAEDDVELLAIPISLMDEWLVKFPTWKSFVMRTIRARFHEMVKTINQLAFNKLDERLVAYLKDKSSAAGSALINLSHEQIANELGTSRVVISRLLKKLENDKKLLLYRHQIKLLSDM